MARISSWVLTTLSLFLGMFFFFSGYIKLSPTLNYDIHRELRRNFVRYAKVVPVLTSLGIKVSPKSYRLCVGYLELICGLILAFCPGTVKQIANLMLVGLTIGAVYTHIMVRDEVDKMYPALAFTFFLLFRLVLLRLHRKTLELYEELEMRKQRKLTLQQQSQEAQEFAALHNNNNNDDDDDDNDNDNNEPDSQLLFDHKNSFGMNKEIPVGKPILQPIPVIRKGKKRKSGHK